MSTVTESLIFSKELEQWRLSHGLTVTALAQLLGVTKQMMSDVLSNKKTFSSENLIKATNILRTYNSINTQEDEYAITNAAVLERYTKSKHARLLNFQSGFGLTQNDGFLPRDGSVEPETSRLT